jgi:CRISPR/Cas system CSM-associated protein Csm4 (group 5 of RAMP superfamily)
MPLPAAETAYWLLSLFRPGDADTVDWSRGAYATVDRTGRIESPVSQGELKKGVRMVAEGSVVFAASPLVGSTPDVAPEGFPHPVYRAGYGLAIAIQWRVTA